MILSTIPFCIFATFCVNFEPAESLKLFLALHLVPLIYRIKSGTQLNNMMAPEIKQSFPLAYDIAPILYAADQGTVSSECFCG